MASIEAHVEQIGRQLLAAMKGERPGLFDKAWWSGQVLEWAMRDPVFKTELFRFVDVFPALEGPAEIARHLQEYLLRPGVTTPAVIRLALRGAGLGKLASKVAAGQIAKNLEGMARTFIVGADAAAAVPRLEALRSAGQGFTVDLLGEATVSEAEAEAYVDKCAALIDTLADRAAGWTKAPDLDRDDRGELPMVNVSLKVSALYSQLDALAFDASVEGAVARLRPLLLKAHRRGVFINLDMEQYAHKALTLALFRRALDAPELQDFEAVGVVIQAYLRDAEADLKALIKWAKKRKRRITVRLVKGAYWDYETVLAEQNAWPSPVWLDKGATDACFERCVELLMRNHRFVRPAIGSHNARSIAYAMASAARHGVPKNGFEVQCLHGMAEPVKKAVASLGYRVRIYCPVGELIPGMAYLVRRLLENTSNEGWLRMGFADGAQVEQLLAKPAPADRGPWLRRPQEAQTDTHRPAVFVNEPLRNFVDPAARAHFSQALALLERALGKKAPREVAPIIAGKRLIGEAPVPVLDPSDGRTVLGHVSMATPEQARLAVSKARKSWPRWRAQSANARAEVLFNLADSMRRQRDALAASMVREVGKGWRAADADVCEAIDFCEYYGRQALRLLATTSLPHVPGEDSRLRWQGRGVCAVIAPWNFPLAIVAGLTTAALAAGNTVVLKPAEQAPLVAELFVRLAHEAGVPGDVLHYLPGRGETVGALLASHPKVATVAFTGSRAVGQQIWRAAGTHQPGQEGMRRAICEMGGKNAIIVDSDADLDEAVLGVVSSTFGFAGQKCSACSRAIVVGPAYDTFVRRLVEAVESLRVGPATDPATKIGPVIDAEAQARLLAVIEDGKHRLSAAFIGAAPAQGFFVPPAVFVDVPPDDTLAQTEHFGPVLCVHRADSFEDALRIANSTVYALTGAVFSRSPAHLDAARDGFQVGNLYLNRGCTGALVGRHPFGGFGLSGGGSKAGGPFTLLEFSTPRCVTENTSRRGFVPPEPS